MAEDYLHKLREAFELYYELGYSVIPILGDLSPANPKAASVDWKEWQTKRATLATFDHWVRQGKVGGLAIVTGSISALAALDFDLTVSADQFQHACPLLWNSTRRQRSATRQLPHVFFRVPAHISAQIRSQTFVGLDVQYEGRYIIVAPTKIAGQSYTVEQGGLPLLLNEFTLHSLQRFLQSQTAVAPEPAKIEDLVASHLVTVSSCIARPMPLPPISSAQAQRKYERLALAGRNKALFAVALELRDSGYAEQAAMQILAPLHIETRQTGETEHQREREAVRSIVSVYSRPARERQGTFLAQLPNVLREKLSQANQLALARVFDGLLQGNVRPGDLIYYSQAVQICRQFGIGTFSVERFFKELPLLLNGGKTSTAESGAGATPLEPPTALPGLPAAFADCSAQNAICRGAQYQEKRNCNLGRPPKYLRLPTFAELAAALNITLYPAVDALPSEALASVRAYRTAQLQARITRRPDWYAHSQFEREYGISQRTVKRYLRVISAVSNPHYKQIPIVRANLGEIPDPDYLPSYTNRAKRTYTPGWFLEDQHGKRYPAYRGIALDLLKKGATLTLKVQTANYYYIAGQPQAAVQWQAEQEQAQQAVEQRRHQWQQQLAERQAFFAAQAQTNSPEPPAEPTTTCRGVADNLPPPQGAWPLSATDETTTPAPGSTSLPRTRRTIAERSATRRGGERRKYQQPLVSASCENLAQRLHQSAPDLSVWSARRLVDQYGYAICQQALVALRKRGGVRDRAAWLYSCVRSEAKFSNKSL